MDTNTFPLKLQEALRCARAAHGTQQYGPHPYDYHLLQVLGVAIEFGITNEHLLIATVLHDTVEDTDLTVADIRNQFGNEVADLVWAVTNVTHHPDTGEKLNRAGKALFTYPKIQNTLDATTLKLCDRVANTRSCWIEAQKQDANKRNKSLLGMYRREYGKFRKALRGHPHEIDRALWNELDRLMAWRN